MCAVLACGIFAGTSFFGYNTKYFDVQYMSASSDKTWRSPLIVDSKVQINENQELIAAYSFKYKNSNDYCVPTLKNLPAIEEYESISLYGTKDGKLEKLAIKNAKNGDSCYLGLFAYDGLSLVKEEPCTAVTMQKVTANPEEGVTVTFEGYMPEGVKTEVVPDEGEGILSYDIKMYDSQGNVFQPTVGHPLKVTIQSAELDKADESQLEAVHINDAGQVEEKAVKAEEGSVTFLADHFSQYTIRVHDTDTGDPVTPRRTYHFLDHEFKVETVAGEEIFTSAPFNFYNTAGDTQNVQIIKNMDSLELIPIPSPLEGLYFYGWYVVDYISDENGNVTYKWDDEPERVHFNRPITVTETQDTDIYVAPLYSNYRFVTFHENEEDQTNGKNVLTRKLVALGENGWLDVKISDVRALPPDATRVVFWGWRYGNHEEQTVNTDDTEMEKYVRVNESDTDIQLYPIFKQARWITFNTGESSNGAKYVSSHFLVQGDSRSDLPTSTRVGYVFSGWYTAPTGGIQVSDADGHVVNATHDLGNGNVMSGGQLTLEENIVLYARWTEINTANYVVIFWGQSVSDSKFETTNKTYDYIETETRSGPSSTELTSTAADRSKSTGKYKGFHYCKTTVNNDGKIKSDGTTVMNVYYDRDMMATNFYYRSQDQSSAPANAGTSYTYTATTSNTGTQYGLTGDGYVLLSTTNGPQVTEWFLTQNNGGTTEYTGNVYVRNGNTYSAATNPQHGDGITYYRRTSNYGNNYSQLYWNSRTVTQIIWMYNGNEYQGTRFTRTNNTSYSKMLTWTGLYGQSFEQNGYNWNDMTSLSWKDNTYTQTFLDAFIYTNPYNLSSQGSNGNKYIYHYKQNLDGSYSADAAYIARMPNSSSGFNFQDKFDGFTVSSYSTSSEGFKASGGTHSASSGSSWSGSTYPIYVYHTRNKYDLTLKYNYVGGPSDYIIHDIPYGAKFSDYVNTNADYYNPTRDHYNFLGWYKADEGDASDPPDFDLNTTMPAANKVAYCHWDPIWYLIEIDPGGAEIDHVNGTDRGSTYFWLPYGSSIGQYYGISQRYVPDENGDYVYMNIKFNDENAGYGINANLRNALYIPYQANGDYHDYYNNTDFDGYTYAGSGISYEDFKACIGTQRFRPIQGNENYSLMGWYRVKNDGTLSSTPYGFSDLIDSNVKLKAVWKRNELYYLAYNPVMTGTSVGGTITQTTDPDVITFDGGKFTDKATAVAFSGPTDITPGYVFQGWRIVDGMGNPLENDVFYDPGEEFTVNSDFAADSSGCIHMEAYYEPSDMMTKRRVSIASLLLDANGGTVNSNRLTPGDTYIYADTTDNQLHFEKQKNNTAVDLMDYYDNFNHSLGFTLIGWNDTADAGDYIPDHYADKIIGIDKKGSNKLYALWEPTVYISFVNQTVDTLELTVTFSNYNGSVYTGHINEVTSRFEREPYTSTKVTLAPGETIKFVLPEGEGAKYNFSGFYQGSKDLLYIYNAGISTKTIAKNTTFNDEGTLINDATGRVITFYDEANYIPPPTGTNLETRAYTLLLIPAAALAAGLIIVVSKRRKAADSI
jgi:uncharacterized repeat protein (TIGR02543 family)